MLVEISKTTDNEVGDGTTSAVILAGALLENAESLITQDVHPTIIVDGYVAPSFVIVTSPKESTNILSIPLGPKLE